MLETSTIQSNSIVLTQHEPCHLPLERSETTLMLDDDIYDITFWLTNSELYICSSLVEVRYVADKSGRSTSPSRYCKTCRMVGLAFGTG